MFKEPEALATSDGAAEVAAATGPLVAALCRLLTDGSTIFIAPDEARAATVAAAMRQASCASVVYLPAIDTLPGDFASAAPAIAGVRAAALSELANGPPSPVLLVTDAVGASTMVPFAGDATARNLVINLREAFDGEGFAAALTAIGYWSDDRIDEPGEFAVWGATCDVFPADAAKPVRLRIEDGMVAAIEPYDSLSQLVDGDGADRLTIVPAGEVASADRVATVFDYLPGAQVALDVGALAARDRFVRGAGAIATVTGVIDAGGWSAALADRTVSTLRAEHDVAGVERFVERRDGARRLRRAITDAFKRGDTVVIAGAERDLRFLTRRLGADGIECARVTNWASASESRPPTVALLELELDAGWTQPGLIVIAAADILGARAGRAADVASVDQFVAVAELHTGDAVVHEDHGLGLVAGIETMTGGTTQDAIALEYAGGARRLVPVAEADRLWRYGGDGSKLTLDKLDGSSWIDRRQTIEAAVAETARHLVELAHERGERVAPALVPPTDAYERFASGFGYRETTDQARAIAAVRADLGSGKPMDRLVVGDVGYGKTEVALRAAAMAVLAGKQVALVAPTTVLVRQHLETFRRRFEGFGVEVAGLSRLESAAEQRRVKQGLADGGIRLVVGTQAVASKTVAFSELGLMIVDEEQRFGAKDKARLRKLVGDGHMLMLTATPIPRTLQSALVGLQELSVIATPPARRVAIRTRVAEVAPEAVRSALEREARRGGQSFVVVPRIEEMDAAAAMLAEWVPTLSVRRAHGKMPVAEIDDEMVRFAGGDGDVLLATNIIEAGLDIPRANTMIVWRADRFGLAQLHQLRGRVGRGRLRGQMLLLTQGDAEIAPATLKRLRTLEAFDQLGAGFAISQRDMDLRGAGDLVGETQAGHVKLIGTALYQHLLEGALAVARGGAAPAPWCSLNLDLEAGIPEDYIADDDVRITLYARLARATSAEAIEAFEAEVEDRFGPLPAALTALLDAARLRAVARSLGIARIDAGAKATALTPVAGATPPAIEGAVAKDGRLIVPLPVTDGDGLRALRELLEGVA